MSVQDRCTVCAKHTIGSEIVLDIMMVLLRDEAQVDACFVLFGDSAKLDARYVYGLCRTYRRLESRFGCSRWNSLVSGSCGMSFPCIWR